MSTNTTIDHHQQQIDRNRFEDPNRDPTQEYFQRSLELVSDRSTRNRRFSIAGDRSTLPSSYPSSNESLPPTRSSFEDPSIIDRVPHHSHLEINETVEAATVLLGLGSSNSTISFSTATPPTTTITSSDSETIHGPTLSHHPPSIGKSKDPGLVIEDMINASIHLSSKDHPRASTQSFDRILHEKDVERPPSSHKRQKLFIHQADLTNGLDTLHHPHYHLDRDPRRTHPIQLSDDRPHAGLDHADHQTKRTDHHRRSFHPDLAIQDHLHHHPQLAYYSPAQPLPKEEEAKLTKKKKKKGDSE